MNRPSIPNSPASSIAFAPAHERRRRRARSPVGGSLALVGSPRLLAAFGAYCACLPVAAWALGSGPWPTLALAALSAGLVWRAWRQLLPHGPDAPRRLVWDGEGHWQLWFADGCCDVVQVQHSTLVLGPWLWLRLAGRRRHSLLLCRHDTDPAAFAALRRQLRTFPADAGL